MATIEKMNGLQVPFNPCGNTASENDRIISKIAQEHLEQKESSNHSPAFHYITSAAFVVLGAAAVVAAVYFGIPILIAAGGLLGIFALLQLLDGIESQITKNQLTQDVKPALEKVDDVTFAEQSIAKEESGEFTAEELSSIGRINGGGYLSPFKSFTDKFPYHIGKDSTSEAIFTSYVKRILGLRDGQEALQRMQECLTLSETDNVLLKVVPIAVALIPGEDLITKIKEYLASDNHQVISLIHHFLGSENPVGVMEQCLQRKALRNKALQLHAFFKLMGNQNQPLPQDVNLELVQRGVMFDPTPTKFGNVRPMMENFGDDTVAFSVKGDQVALYTQDDLAKKVTAQEGPVDVKPLATLRAGRSVMIFPPDANGNVSYHVNRSFSKFLSRVRHNTDFFDRPFVGA